jgi:hypothetical protein
MIILEKIDAKLIRPTVADAAQHGANLCITNGVLFGSI